MGKVYADLKVNGDFIYNNSPIDGYILSTDADGLVSWTASSVIESADYASLPATGLNSRLYITLNNNNTYRWDGAAYQPIKGLVLTTNIIYVSKSGDDLTGARHDLGKPFLTIESAVTVAQPGDLIKILPGSYSVASNIAKDGISYYLEPGAIVNNSIEGVHTFDTTGFTKGFNVYGYGEFNKTGGSGFILYSNSYYGGNSIVFECKRVYSNQNHIFYIEKGFECHWKVDYALATAGMIMYMNFVNTGGASFKIDFNNWTSTGSDAISGNWWYYSSMQLNGNALVSTAGAALSRSLNGSLLNINVNYISGVHNTTFVGANTAIWVYEYTESITINCGYCRGVSVNCYGTTLDLSGAFGWVYYNCERSTLIGGTIQYLRVDAGHAKTTVARIPYNMVDSPSFTINGGKTDLTYGSSNYEMRGSVAGGVLNLYGNTHQNQYYNGSVNITGGQLNVMGDMVIANNINFWPADLFNLSGGTLKVRAKIYGNMLSSGNPTPDGALIVWSGGDLIFDGATLITPIADYYAIRSMSPGNLLKVLSGGFNYNITEYGGPHTGQYHELIYTVQGVATTSVIVNSTTITESDIVTYDTAAKLAQRITVLVNSNGTLGSVVTAFQENPGTDTTFRIRSNTKGPYFAHNNGLNTSRSLIRYGSYPFGYIGNGMINIHPDVE